MDDQLTPQQQADIILNRANVALARSQRLIQSWLPAKSAAEESPIQVDEGGDFNGMTEVGGIGSKTAFADDGLPDGSLQRQKLSSNDKLLEQLLGKKAAQAHKKAQGKSLSTSKHAAPKPLQSKPKPIKRAVESDEEEEEEGRAASFKSRKMKHVRPERPSETALIEDKVEQESGKAERATEEGDEGPRPQQIQDSAYPRKKPASYLDELLSSKKSKKSKKKKKINVDELVQ